MSNSMMFVRESKPMRSLKDKYRIDKTLSAQRDVLKETGFCSIGLGEFFGKNSSVTIIAQGIPLRKGGRMSRTKLRCSCRQSK